MLFGQILYFKVKLINLTYLEHSKKIAFLENLGFSDKKLRNGLFGNFVQKGRFGKFTSKGYFCNFTRAFWSFAYL